MLLQRIDALATRTLAESEAEGLAIGISWGDERVIRTYGFANRDAGLPVAEETLFEIGSISKSALAIVCMQLAADGRLDLHAPVSDYLPWFSAGAGPVAITPHHLLCHSAGLPTGSAHYPDGLLEIWELRDARTVAPGTAWNYSDVGYNLLGCIVDAVLGQTLDRYLHERVLDPLGLTSSYASVTSGLRPRLAVGYKRLLDDRPWQSGGRVYPATWMETSIGAGSIVMNASDLLAYTEILGRAWDGFDTPVLSTAQLRAMIDPARLPLAAVEEEYGYALWWRSAGGSPGTVQAFGHGGDMVGYESSMLVEVEHGIRVVMLANGVAPGSLLTSELCALIAASIDGRPLPEISTDTLRRYDGAADWIGRWQSHDRSIEIRNEPDGLALLAGADPIPLQRVSRRSNDLLTVGHPGWDQFLLEGTRGQSLSLNNAGPIVALSHGGETFVRAGSPLPEIPASPPEWDGLPGLYRSWNPWYPAVRVVLRMGRLLLIDTNGWATPLIAEGDGFRVGEADPAFDFVRFGAVIDGKAHRLCFDTGAVYSRFIVQQGTEGEGNP